LKIEGNVSLPAVIKEHFTFYVSVNGQKNTCEMYDAGFDRTIDGETYETRTAFRFEKTLDENMPYELSFFYCCDGIDCKSGKINAMRFSPVADVLESQYAVRNNWILWIEKSTLFLKTGNDGEIEQFEKNYRTAVERRLDSENAEYVTGLRQRYFERKKKKVKPVWLFCDRLDKADDNGEAMFRYVCSRKQEEADCYFLISKNAPDYEKICSVGNVVDALSEEHCLLLLEADYIFTSQLNGWVENPFGAYEEYFRDLYHQAKIVFLQHGVTKDNQTKWLNRYNQNLYAVVTSSEREKQSFLEYPYFYEEKQIWNTGMPRFDRLYSENKKYILFMPTWRKEVMEQRWNPQKGSWQWYLKDDFKNSSYYDVCHKVLNDGWFLTRCRWAGYQVIFMPHPIMQPYAGEFHVSKRVIALAYDTSWRELFAESSIMITDYSSVAFDFAYLRKPVIYFQFDRAAFFASHTYKPGYFDYTRMGFGEVVTTEKQLYQTIYQYIRRKCQMKPEYEKRRNDFFTNQDTGACERVYRKVNGESYELQV
jgi:CDP-glycerol glycerophosphotransferase (TagB/SpsB family)